MTSLENLGEPFKINVDPRHEYKGLNISAEIVESGNDLILHLGNPGKNFKKTLTDAVNSFFTDSETFGIDYIPEVDNYSLYAIDAQINPLVNSVQRAKEFLRSLDQTIGAAND